MGAFLLRIAAFPRCRYALFADIVCVAALGGLCAWVFGERSSLLGLYSDDATFITHLEPVSFSKMLHSAVRYLPGRNFHYVWEYLLLLLTGNTLDSMPAQHAVATGFIALDVEALYVALRLIALPTLPCFAAASLFAFYPGRAEAFYWLQAIPMHLVSTFLIFVLVILAIAAVQAARIGARRRAVLCLIGQCIVFVPALWTYDQADIVVMIAVTMPTLLCGFWMRPLRPPAVVLLGVYLTAFIVLVVVKILYPSGGPTFAQLTLGHLLTNFHSSLSINFGHGLYDLVFNRLLPHAGEFERRIALGVAIATFVAGAIGAMLAGLAASSSQADSRFRAALPSTGLGFAVMAGGAVFFLAAYLPADVWYISPRHDYLPSVGVAMLAAGAVSLVVASCTRLNKFLGGAMAVLVLAGLAGFLYVSVQTILVEKTQWIVSYQARKHLYAELVRDPKFRAASTLVLDGFPAIMPLSSAPLGYQQPTEAALMTNGAAKMLHIVPSAAPASHGEFIYLEGNVWGENAFLYVPDSKIYHIYFQRLHGDHIDYAAEESSLNGPRVFSLDDPGPGGEHIVNVDSSAANTAPGPQSIDVSVPSIEVGDGSAVALRPLIEDHGGLAPLTAPNAQGGPCEVLINVSRFAEGTSHRARVTFDAAIPRIKGLEFWLVGESGRRLIRRDLLDR